MAIVDCDCLFGIAYGGFCLPRYDYRCSQCDHSFELRQSFNSEPVATCPECSAVATRQFHAPPVFFKGSGWYVNDYGKGRSNEPTAEKDKKEAKDPDSKDKVSANKDSDSNSKKDSSSNTTKSD